MDDQKYVTRLMRARCSKGTMENYLNVDIDHGIVVGADVQPLMNANDHVSGRHVIHFGCCESDQNPERMFRKALVGGFLGGFIADALEDVGIMTCKCKPNTPNPWQFVNDGSIVEGAPALMVCSTLTCRYGGVIEIIDPDGNGNIDIPETSEDSNKNDQIDQEMFNEILATNPELATKLSQWLQDVVANGVIGQTYEYSFPISAEPKTTYTIAFTPKAKGESLLTVGTSLSEHIVTLKGNNWSISETGAITLGSDVSLSVSPKELSIGVKVGADTPIDDYTTLKAPVYSVGINMFGQGVISEKQGMVTDTPYYTLGSTLKIEETIDRPQLQYEYATQPTPEKELQPALAAPATPWYEKGWNWACDAVTNTMNWVSDNGEKIAVAGTGVALVVLWAGAVLEPTPAGEATAAAATAKYLEWGSRVFAGG